MCPSPIKQAQEIRKPQEIKTDLQGQSLRFETTYGVRAGYRFNVDNYYIAPWLGVDKVSDHSAVELGGAVLERDEFVVFPTVHAGYRF